MKVIYKYPIDGFEAWTLALPADAELLHVDYQAGQGPALWVLHTDPAEEPPMAEIKLVMIGTGHPIEITNPMAHVGTFLMGPLVWHVFEVLPRG